MTQAIAEAPAIQPSSMQAAAAVPRAQEYRPLVSIIITNYNYGRFLSQAIESALGQTYPRIEVIVVDDGSTDNSRVIIAGFAARIKAVLKENGGHASAQNAGFAASRGEIVLFLDADDMMLPEAIEEVVRAWSPTTTKAQYVLEHIDGEGRRLGTTTPYAPQSMPSGDVRELILKTGSYIGPPTSGGAYSRALLERLFPLPEKMWYQGADCVADAVAPFFGDLVSMPRVLGLYRVHDLNNGALSKVEPKKLRIKLVLDVQREAVMREIQDQAGFSLPVRWCENEPGHIKYRLASLKMAPRDHPFLDDRSWWLALKGVRAYWKSPNPNLRCKVFNTLWLPLVAILPQKMALRLIEFDLLPRKSAASSVLRGWLANAATLIDGTGAAARKSEKSQGL